MFRLTLLLGTWSTAAGTDPAGTRNDGDLSLQVCPGHRVMDNTPIICDYGSGSSKVGFAGTEAPLAVFPTILGKLKYDVSDLLASSSSLL